MKSFPLKNRHVCAFQSDILVTSGLLRIHWKVCWVMCLSISLAVANISRTACFFNTILAHIRFLTGSCMLVYQGSRFKFQGPIVNMIIISCTSVCELKCSFVFQCHHIYLDTDMAYDVSKHYTDVIMTTMASRITSLTVVYSIVYSGADQRKHQSSASLAFVQGIHRDRWIHRTKGHQCGKCFHLMTSSW